MKASLNHIFRSIWSDALNTWVAVSEITSAKGKRSKSCVLHPAALAHNDSETGNLAKPRRRLRLKPLALALTCCYSFQAFANPVGAQIVNGTASINQSGTLLTVTNTPNAIINWQGFSINKGETTNFIQQSAASSVLNRVVGPDPSALLGNLTSNGKVFLINPAGILVGQGARIDVPGFVASTLNLSNADFLAGKLNFISPLPQAGEGAVVRGSAVVNNGTITTPEGGSVYLIAPQVENNGIINTPKGETILAAGNTVQLIDTCTPGVSVQITGSTNVATNLGQILADSGRIGMVGAVVKNSGTLNANSLVSQGGKIFLKATHRVDAGGTLSAQGTSGGNISVLADMQTGTLNVTGTLDASAPLIPHFDKGGLGGISSANGGFIETSAAHVQVADSAHITTAAPNGKSGTWLIDPTDYTIAATDPANGSSYMSNSILVNSLTNGNVTIQTLDSGTGNGDIFINDAVSWGSANSLTLNAIRHVNINASISNSGAGNLLVRADLNGSSIGTINFAANANVALTGGGRADLYYNPVSYTDAATKSDTTTNPYTTYLGNTPYTAWMLVNNAGQETGSTLGLQALTNNPAGNYALGANIDATVTSVWNAGAGFTPIGTAISFSGTFDGLGHTISNLTINLPTTTYVGLFGYADPGSVIRNVGVIGGNVIGGDKVGGLAGRDRGTISNSYFTGSVSGGRYVGGVVGYLSNNSTVSNSYATGNVTGSSYVGGLVGGNFGAVDNSYAAVTVTGTGNNVGGLIGSSNYGASVSNTYATGIVSGTGNAIGGLVGGNYGRSTVTNSFYDSTVNSTLTGIGSTADVGGTVWGMTTAAMRNLANFTTAQAGTVANNFHDGNGGVNPNWVFTITPGATGNNWVIVDADGTLNNGVNGSAGATFPMLASEYSTTINNAHQLQLMEMNLGASYTLVQNINAAATSKSSDVWDSAGFVPLGNSGTSFTGVFNGLGHTISNLTINQPGSSSIGLFGYGSATAIIENVGLTGINVIGHNNVGGLLGNNYGTVSNSYVSGNVSGAQNVGGLVGYASNYKISNSYFSGSTSGIFDVGGLAGSSYGGTIIDSHAAGSVSATRNAVGGLIGNVGGGTISNSYNTGIVSGSNYVGGLVGQAAFSLISNSYTTGNVNGTGSVNLLSGGVGGLVGYMIANVTIDNSYTTGNVSATLNNAGGLVGYNNRGTITNSHATGGVVGGGRYAGGLVGQNWGTISNSYATGSVSGNTYVGGLLGISFNNPVSNSYATGNVSGSSYVGGLVGDISGSALSNVYATGSVTGTTDVGGLAGWLSNNGNNLGSISNSFAKGNVTGTSNVGGLLGIRISGTVTNSFYNSDSNTGLSGISGAVDAGGTVWGMTTLSMMNFANFSSATGTTNITDHNGNGNVNPSWSIANTGSSGAVWRIYEGNTAPLLTSFLTPLTLTGSADVTVTYDGSAHTGSAYTGSTQLGANTNISGVSIASQTNAGVYSGYYSTQQGYDITGGNLTITPLQISLTAVGLTGVKVYDGNSVFSTGQLSINNIVGQDTVSLSAGSADTSNRNVGTWAFTSFNGLTLTGPQAGNYTLSGVSGSGTISQLASVDWVGGTTGIWSNAANWAPSANHSATGAIPDGSNVAAVTIASGNTVTYDSGVVGTTLLNSLNNSGTVNLNAGTLSITNTFTQSGTINIASGAVLSDVSGFTNTGTLTGTGTIAVGTGTSKLVNQGTINPGGTGAIGTLAITGDLQLNTSASILNIEVGGTNAAPTNDLLTVSGATSISAGSVLNGLFTGSYTGTIGNAFTYLTQTGTATGTFTTVNSPAGPKVTPAYLAGSNTLTLGTWANNWAGTTSTDWSVAGNWSRGVAPGSWDVLTLNTVTNNPSVNTGTVGNAYSIAGTAPLTVNGGTLTVANASTYTGAVNVNSGTLALNGATSLTTLNLTGGTLSNLTTLNIGALNVVAGPAVATITGAGAVNLTGTSAIGATSHGNTPSSLTIDGGGASKILTNSGTLTLTGDGNIDAANVAYLYLANGASLVNTSAGTINLNSGAISGGANANGGFSNQGTVNTGTGIDNCCYGPANGGSINVLFTNSGTVNGNAGTLTLSNAGAETHTGTFNTTAGASINFAAGTQTLDGTNNTQSNALTGQSITGSGNITFSGGTLSNITGAVNSTGSMTNNGTAVTTLSGATTLPTVNLSAGTMNFNETGPTTLTTLNLTGGTLSNLTTLNIGALNVVAGPAVATITGAGAVNLTGTSAIGATNHGSTPSSLTIDGGGASKILTNSGKLTLTGDGNIDAANVAYLYLANGASLVNTSAGTINLNSGAISAGANANGGFNNQGTVNTGTGIDNCCYGPANGGSINVLFTNSGTVNANVGTLSITNALTQSGTINVASGAIFSYTAGFTNSGILSGSGTIAVGTGAAALINQGTINPGGTGTAGTLAITGDLQLSTGSILNIDLGGTGTGQSDKLAVTGAVTMGGILNASLLSGYTPTNTDGISLLTKGSTASGTFTSTNLPSGFSAGYNLFTGEAARLLYASGGTITFTNAGNNLDWSMPGNWSGGVKPGSLDTALLSTGYAVGHSTGTDSIAALTINSGNSLNVSGGSLTVSGITTLDGGLTVSGTGSAALNGALNGATTGQISLSAGSLTLGGLSTVNSLNLTGGTLNNAATLNVGALTFANSVTASATLTGAGAVNLTGTGGITEPSDNGTHALTLTIDGGKVLTNSGTFTESGTRNPSSGTTVVLANGASLVNTSTGSWSLLGGSITAGTGAGGFTNNGIVVSGAGPGTGYGTAYGGTIGVLFTNAGTVNGNAGTLTLSNAGAAIHTGTFNTVAGGSVNFAAGTQTLNGQLNNQNSLLTGTAISGTGDITFSGATVNSVSGIINSTGSLTNSGTAVTTVTGATTLARANVSGGTLNFNNTDSTTLTSMALSGGTLNLNYLGVTTLSSLAMTGGTLNNAATLNIGALTFANSVTASATLTGAGAVNLTGTGGITEPSDNGTHALTLTIDGGKVLTNSGTFTESGTRNPSSGTTVVLANGASLVNTSTGSWSLLGGSITAGTGAGGFTNNGTVVSGAGAGTGYGTAYGGTVSVGFNNVGTINANIGTISMAGSFTQSGTINVASGATFSNTAGFTNTGTLSGTGTIVVGTGANGLINQGTINPGGSGVAGTLAITGDLQLSTGSILNIDLGGTTAGQSDKLAVTGTGTMGGTLNAVLLPGYTPTNANAIPFLMAAGTPATGTFSTTNLPLGFSTGYNLATGEAAKFIYAYGASTITFTNAGNNLDWATPVNWSGGLLPRSLDTVLISTSLAVKHTTGTDTIAALTINSGNSLNVSGGSLAVSGITTLDGALNVSGTGSATLNGVLNGATTGQIGVAAGTLNLAAGGSVNSLSVTGGTLAATGLTVNAPVTVNGGTLNFSGGILNFNNGFTLGNGILKNLVLRNGATSGLVSVNAGTLDGITLDSDLNVNNGVLLHVLNGLTIQNNHSLLLTPTGSTVTLSFDGWQNIGGTGHIVFNGTESNYRVFINSSGGSPGVVFGPGVTFDINHSGTIDGAGANNQVFTSQGTMNIASGKTLNIRTIASILNSGVLNDYGILSIDPSNLGPTNCCSFSNTGQFNVFSGSATILGNGNDTGSYSVSSGASLNFNGAGVRTWGASYNLAGGSIGFNNQSIALAGSITGSGTLNFGSGTLINNGTISPGGTGTAGTLAITGNLLLSANSILNVDLGTGTGQSDKLTVTGNITNAGTLNASLLSGYSPVNADNTAVLTMGGTSSGTFATTNLPSGFSAGYNLAAGEAARLIYAYGPGTLTFTNASGGLDWATPGNWSGGILPGSLDTALISTGSYAVTHSTGIDTIAALTINGGNSLNVSGGSLAVTGITTLGGGLTVSGTGSAVLNGALNGATSGQVSVSAGSLNLGTVASLNALNLSGGTLTSPYSLTAANYTQSGGTLNIGGTTLLQSTGSMAVNGAIASSLGGTLTLQAVNNIVLGTGGSITGSVSPLQVILDANSTGTGGAISLAAGTSISSNGGDITLGGGSGTISAGVGFAQGANALGYVNGVSVLGNLTAAGGNIVINGIADASTNGLVCGVGGICGVSGIDISGNNTVGTSGAGTITLTGQSMNAGAATKDTWGVNIGNLGSGSGNVTSVDGTILINATSGSATTAIGALIYNNSVVQSTGSGNVTINGTVGNNAVGTTHSRGVDVDLGTSVRTNSGLLTIVGVNTATAGSVGNYYGVQIDGGSVVGSQTGAINLTGTGGGTGNQGIVLDKGIGSTYDSSGSVTSTTGSILLRSLNGTGIGLTSATINTVGNVTLDAVGGGAITQTTGSGSITAAGLRVLGDTNATASLTSATNHVTTLAGNLSGTTATLSYTDSGAFGIGALTTDETGTGATTTTSGLSVGGNVVLNAAGSVTNSVALNVGGALDIQSGGVSGSGTLNVTGGTSTVSGNLTAATLNQSNGTLNLNGAASSLNTVNFSGGYLSGTGGTAITGAFNWTRGILTGTATTTVSGALNINPAAYAHFDVQLDGASLINTNTAGTSHWNGLADWRIINGATFQNSGIFEFQALDPTVGRSIIGGGATSVVRNTATGTFLKTGPTWTNIGFGSNVRFENAGAISVGNQMFVVNSDSIWTGGTGSISMASGGTFYIGGGTNDLGATPVTGAGTFVVQQNVGYSQALGTTTTSGIFTPGTLTVNAATLNVNGTTAPGSIAIGTLNISNGVANFNNSQPVTFANTVTLTGVSGQLNGSANLIMNGTFNWSGNADTNGPGTLTTNATTNISGNGNYANRHWINTGTVNLLAGANDFEMPPGSVLDNQGTFNMNSSKVNPIASLWGGSATFNNSGTLNWNGSGVQSVDSPVQMNNTGTLNVISGTYNQAGIFTQPQTGTLTIASGATFQNTSGFTNAGTLQGSGTVAVGTGSAALINQGNINPGGTGVVGTLAVTGDLQLAAGSTLNMELGGTGTSQSDVLTVTGKITSGGTLNASLLTGYTPINTDAITFLTMGGSATGTFATNLPSGFSAGYNLATGEAARLIYASGPGTFTFTNASGGLDWAIPGNWSRGVLPGTLDTALLSSGLAVTHITGTDSIAALTINNANSLNISGGSLTVSGITTLGGGLSVSGTGSATLSGALNGGSSGQLSVAGGTLNLGAAATMNSLSMTGGTLVNAVSLSTPTLSMTGGILNGAGSLAVTNSFTQTTGVLGNTFSGIDITQATGDLTVGSMGSTGAVYLASSAGILTGNGIINGTLLTTHSVGGTTLNSANSVTSFNATNTGSGNISLTNNVALNVTGISQSGGGSVNVTNTGSITTSGMIAGDGNINLFATGNALDDVIIGNGIIYTGTTSAGALEIRANRNILVQASPLQAMGTQALNVLINADSDANSSGGIAILAGGDILSNGGNITLGGGSNPLLGYAVGNGATTGNAIFNSGIYLTGNITAGAGNVTMHGQGAANAGDGISLAGGLLSSNGLVTLDGVALAAGIGKITFVAGVNFTNTGTRLSTSSGTVNVLGISNSSGASSQGVQVNAATLETTGNGTLTINGTSNGYTAGWAMGIINGGTVQSTAAGGGLLSFNGISARDGGIVIGASGYGNGNVLSNGGEIRIKSTAALDSILLGDTTIGGSTSGNILLQSTNATNVTLGTGTLLNAGANALTISLAGGTALESATSSITAGSLRLLGTGSFNLSGANNNVATLAADITGNVNYYAIQGVYIGSINSFDGTSSSTTNGILTRNGNFTAVANNGVTPGNITLNSGGSINLGSGALNLAASGGNLNINDAVIAGTFTLSGGTWNQVSATLPGFSVTDFRIAGGSFIRALGGNGTSAAPYQLTDIYGVQGMASAGMLGNSYVLANNVDASGTLNWNAGAGFAPIGGATATTIAPPTASQFTGTLDGLNHTINNLSIKLPASNEVGLFGYTSPAAVITNVGLVGGSVSGVAMVGGLVGWNYGKVSNSYNTGNVSGSSSQIGGLLGNNSKNTVSNSYATGSVSGSGYVGGLVGAQGGSTISNSYATGNVSSSPGRVGGLVGTQSGSNISNSYATGSVSGGGYVGGLVGYNLDSSSIHNSYATGNVTGGGEVGGLVGFNNPNGRGTPLVENSYATGIVTQNPNANFSGWWMGTAYGLANFGGLIGYSWGQIVNNSFWNLTTSGQATSAGGSGLTQAQMQTASSFTGWNIANTGGSGAVWRIYEGHTAPLLTSFLTPLTLTDTGVNYNGAVQNGASSSLSRLLGTAASGLNAGTYNGYYSNQQGYDLTGGNLTITPYAVSITGSRPYDGSNTVAANIFTLGALVAGETLTLSGSGSIASSHVSAGSQAVTLGSLALVGNGSNGAGLASNYTFAGGVQTATITAAPLTSTASIVGTLSKVYDGTTTATNASLSSSVQGGITGDTLTLTGYTLNYNTAQVATASTINATGTAGFSIGSSAAGSLATDYSFTGPSIVAANGASITARTLSTWSGLGGNSLWSNPANWDALPDGNNVLAVSIPAGNSVIYDGAVATTTLPTLTNAGNLAINGTNLSIANYNQSGGSLSGNGVFSVSNAFSQTGGTLALNNARIAITQASGNLNFTNIGILNIDSLTVANGNININNTGAVSTTGLVAAQATNPANATVDIYAHSPLTIGLGGIIAGGTITLTAGATGGTLDILSINGSVVSSNGNINLSAGSGINVGGTGSVLAPHGNIYPPVNLNVPTVSLQNILTVLTPPVPNPAPPAPPPVVTPVVPAMANTAGTLGSTTLGIQAQPGATIGGTAGTFGGSEASITPAAGAPNAATANVQIGSTPTPGSGSTGSGLNGSSASGVRDLTGSEQTDSGNGNNVDNAKKDPESGQDNNKDKPNAKLQKC